MRRGWKVVTGPGTLPQALLPPPGSGRPHLLAPMPGRVKGAGQVWFTFLLSGTCSPLFLALQPGLGDVLLRAQPQPRRRMERMGCGPHGALPLTYAPPLACFPQRPGMSPGSRMPMAGLQVGPPAGSPFGTAAPLRPGMPPTMMDPFRKRLLVPQAQPPMPAQRRG